MRVAAGEDLEGVGEQRIAREQGGGLVKLLVAGEAPAAQVTVVNQWQIIVYEGVGM